MKIMDGEQLLPDVAKHKMTVRLDNGLYRHLRFRQPDSSNLWFEIVTWPHGLTIHGDMGTWSFSRVEDMFTFFRRDDLRINASYWHEKVTSESRFGGPSKTFNPEHFKANVFSHLDGCVLSDSEKAEIIDALGEEVFCDGEDESTVRRALADFEHGGFRLYDTWEINGETYTHHFLWCLHAIVWAIQQYDAPHAELVGDTQGESHAG